MNIDTLVGIIIFRKLGKVFGRSIGISYIKMIVHLKNTNNLIFVYLKKTALMTKFLIGNL